MVAEWIEIAELFESQWNFPKCIGAMDGKHILIKIPRNSDSYFFNDKGSFSIILLALVDANYSFIYVDVGNNGRVSNGGVSKNSSLERAIGKNMLNLPSPRPILPSYRVIVEGMEPTSTLRYGGR